MFDRHVSLYDPSGCEWNKLALQSGRGQRTKKEREAEIDKLLLAGNPYIY